MKGRIPTRSKSSGANLCERPRPRTLGRHVARRTVMLRSAPPEEARRVAPEQLLARVAAEGLPRHDIVDRIRKLAFGVRVIGGVHQRAVAQKRGDHSEHVLTLLTLDAAEEPAAR